jgi:hypothetical protein
VVSEDTIDFKEQIWINSRLMQIFRIEPSDDARKSRIECAVPPQVSLGIVSAV